MNSFRTSAILSLAVFVAAPVTTLAADVAYAGPPGWAHVDVAAPSDANHAFAQWHIPGDIATVTFIRDATTRYADVLANIHKNFSDNGIKTSIDKDIPCRGAAAHVIEFSTGPEGKKVVINRMLVPITKGVATITYSRADGSTFDSDVQKSETAFCEATP